MFYIKKIYHSPDIDPPCYLCDKFTNSEDGFYTIVNNLEQYTGINICKSCYFTKWPEYSGCEPYEKFPAKVNKNFVFFPVNPYLVSYCHACYQDDVSISKYKFYTLTRNKTYVLGCCVSCLENDVSKFIAHMKINFRTQELLATFWRQGFYVPISELNDSEKNKVLQRYQMIKKLVCLPTVLQDIVIEYYWL